MAGRVDDIDLDVGVMDRGVFRHDRDAALAFEVHGVHDPFGDLLVGAENPALVQQGVDQSGFAMVDVGDDRDVAQGIAPLSELSLSHHSWLLKIEHVQSLSSDVS